MIVPNNSNKNQTNASAGMLSAFITALIAALAAAGLTILAWELVDPSVEATKVLTITTVGASLLFVYLFWYQAVRGAKK
jgi:hypothetical protein